MNNIKKRVHHSARWNELENATKIAIRNANSKKSLNILPYFLSASIMVGGISAPNVPYFQKKDTKQLIQYVEDSAKAEKDYKKVVLPAKLAERDSVMAQLNPIDSMACEGCSKVLVEKYLEGKNKIYKKVLEKIGHSDVAAAQRISRECSKFNIENISLEELIGMIYSESRGIDTAKSGKKCGGYTGMSEENAKSMGYDVEDIYNPIKNVKMADRLYAYHENMLKKKGLSKSCLPFIAHAIGGPNTIRIIDKSGLEVANITYPEIKRSKAYQHFFGKEMDDDTRALKNYLENASIGYDISKNPEKTDSIIDARDASKYLARANNSAKHKYAQRKVLLAQR